MLFGLAPLPSALEISLRDPAFQGAILSVTVTDAAGNHLLARNSDIRVMPASNQKLVSGAFALDALGKDWRPKTRFWRQGRSVFVDSAGDPSMSPQRLQEIASRLRVEPGSRVFVNQSYAPYVPDSWEIDDLALYYAAPVCAFTVNQGSTALWWEKGRFAWRPQSFGWRVDRGPQAGNLRVRPHLSRHTVDVSGMLPKVDAELESLAISEPDQAAASYLGRYEGPWDGKGMGEPILVSEGDTIAEQVRACLPPSDNNMAENLMLMAAQSKGSLGEVPYEVARTQMTEFLTGRVGVPETDLNIFDGSGLSRHNLLTTRSLCQLMNWMRTQPTHQDWLLAMARPGSGTLRTRLAGVDFAGKTGGLDKVVALTGYLRTKRGASLTVSVIVNHFRGSAASVRAAVDRIVVAATSL